MAAKYPGQGLAHIRCSTDERSLLALGCACQAAPSSAGESFHPPGKPAQNNNWEHKLAGGHEILEDHVTEWLVGVGGGKK